MYCLSITYKTTPLKVREQLSFTLDNKIQFENQLINQVVKGCIIVSTCNRTEFYFSGKNSSIDEVVKSIVKEKKISYHIVKEYIQIYRDDEATRHLCQVVCGMDSMVVGEDEILRQVKEAYITSLANKTSNNELNIIFQGAIHVAKAVRTKTRISSTAISIGTLTANEVMKFIRGKKNGNVLIVGATGKMGGLIAKILSAKEGVQLIGTTRNQLREGVNESNNHMKWIPYGERYQSIVWADVVISATSNSHYVFTGEKVEKVLRGKDYNKLFIDLAVPGDMDKAIKQLNHIRLVDIDDFKHLSMENNQIKEKEMEKAKVIIEDGMEEIRKAIYYTNIGEEIKELEKIVGKKGFPFVIYKLKKFLTADEIAIVIKGFRLLIKEEN